MNVLYVTGHFQKLSRSTLVFNITTPIEKFKLIKGRFGFSEVQRHLVAQIEYPTGKTGIEVRFLIVSLANFDVLFDLATPLEFLQDVLIVGKLQPAAVRFHSLVRSVYVHIANDVCNYYIITHSISA